MVVTLNIAALVFTVVGTLCAVSALVQEWRTRRPGEPLWPAAVRLWRRLVALVRRPKTVERQVQAAAATLSATGSLTTRHYRNVPRDTPAEEQVAFLRDQVDDLMTDVAELREQAANSKAELQGQLSALDQQRRTAEDTLRSDIREAATGSIRLELVGLVLVTFGASLGTWANLL